MLTGIAGKSKDTAKQQTEGFGRDSNTSLNPAPVVSYHKWCRSLKCVVRRRTLGFETLPYTEGCAIDLEGSRLLEHMIYFGDNEGAWGGGGRNSRLIMIILFAPDGLNMTKQRN
jgi:hypothetical protein